MDPTVVAAILTGGDGRRMGGGKPAVRLPDGRSLLAAVAATAGDVADAVWRVGGPAELSRPAVGDANLPPGPGPRLTPDPGPGPGPDPGLAAANAPNLRHVPDARPGQGPLAGVEAAARAAMAPAVSAGVLLILTCDMPDIPAAWLRELVRLAADPSPRARPRHFIIEHPAAGPRPFPLAGRPADLAAAATAQLDAGDRRARALVAALDAAPVRVPAAGAPWLRNVNDPASADHPRCDPSAAPALLLN